VRGRAAEGVFHGHQDRPAALADDLSHHFFVVLAVVYLQRPAAPQQMHGRFNAELKHRMPPWLHDHGDTVRSARVRHVYSQLGDRLVAMRDELAEYRRGLLDATGRGAWCVVASAAGHDHKVTVVHYKLAVQLQQIRDALLAAKGVECARLRDADGQEQPEQQSGGRTR
jgi:hypothetical protein